MTLATDNTSLADFIAGIPGVYRGIDERDYRRLDLCSFSRLAKIDRSPRHCIESIRKPEETPSLKGGSAAHTFVLQPELIDSRYTVAAQCSARTKAGQRCSKGGTVADVSGCWYCGQHADEVIAPDDRIVLTEREMETANGIRLSIYANDCAARRLIQGATDRELSLIWVDSLTGVKCKARLDAYHAEHGCIIDLKTTTDARPQVFHRKLFGYFYHGQAGLYLDGARENGLSVQHFLFLPVETKPPFEKSLCRVLDDVANAGLEHARRLMPIYDRCQRDNEWPGYEDKIHDLNLPTWDWKQLNQSEDDQ